MSFTRTVRDELARLRPPRACCERAELLGLGRAAGSLHLLPASIQAFEIEAEDPSVVRKAYAALSRALGVPVEVRLFEPGRGRPRPRFVVHAEGFAASALSDVMLTDGAGRPAEPPRRAIARRCDAASYLRGVFLVRGSVSEPRAPAHLELRFPSPGDAATGESLMQRLGVAGAIRHHKGAWVVTVKGAPDAGRLLAAMGAHQAYLEWEEGTVWKSVRGEANRLANCDTANARRTVVSAISQRALIEELQSSGVLERLPAALREAAELRLRHPQAPLEELARRGRPPVTKAAMADRFRRLGRHAESLVG